MMRRRILLQLCDFHVRAEYLTSSPWPLARESSRSTASVALEGESLEQALQQAAAALEHDGAQLTGARLTAQLGMSHARVGLLFLREGNGQRLSFQELEARVMAWVRAVMHLDPTSQVIRWRVLRDPHHVLVSCVDKATYTALNGFAQARRMRFTSCIPAFIEAFRRAPHGPVATMVWTEGAGQQRDSAIQIARLVNGQPVAMWRGWAPPSQNVGHDDPDVEGALRRFEARHPHPGKRDPVRRHWPTPAPSQAQG